MRDREWVDRVASAPLLDPRANGEHERRRVAGRDQCVAGARWAVDEIPRLEWAFDALDYKRAATAEDEEVLLPRLIVVERHRPAGRDPVERDSELVEMRLPLAAEPAPRPEVVVHPSRIPAIDHEPARGHRYPVLKSCLG